MNHHTLNVPKPQQTWRRLDEDILFRGLRFPFPGSAPSLHPDASIMQLAALCDDPEAMQIIDSWAFRCPVELVSA